MRRQLWAAAFAVATAACGEPSPAASVAGVHYDCPRLDATCASACDGHETTPLMAFDAMELPALPPGTEPVAVRLAVATAWPDGALPFDRAEALAWFTDTVNDANEALSPCKLALAADARVVAVAAGKLVVEGNAPGSWGGSAPAGADPDAFNYALGERLPDDVRALFSDVREGAGDGAITVLFVDDIFYSTAGERRRAGGLSYPPVVYHDPRDFPARNTVLVGSAYPTCGALPIPAAPRTIAHELGHMLLDTAPHSTDPRELMSSALGDVVSAEQCARMLENLTTLYGEPPVVDPGAPPRGRALSTTAGERLRAQKLTSALPAYACPAML